MSALVTVLVANSADADMASPGGSRMYPGDESVIASEGWSCLETSGHLNVRTRAPALLAVSYFLSHGVVETGSWWPTENLPGHTGEKQYWETSSAVGGRTVRAYGVCVGASGSTSYPGRPVAPCSECGVAV